MIIYENGEWQTDSAHPNELYDSNAKYCIADNSELANKYKKLFPDCILKTNEQGEVVDVVEIQQTKEQLHINYESLCVKLIREKYSADDEYKVLREYLADMSNSTEFDTYNNYVKDCKLRAMEQIFN